MQIPQSTLKKLLFLVGFGALIITSTHWFEPAGHFLAFMISVFSPFIVGAAIAFVLNVPMKFIEIKLSQFLSKHVKKKVSSNHLRATSLILTILFIIAIILLLVLVIVPQLAITISGLGATIQSALSHFLKEAKIMFANNPQITPLLDELSVNWQEINWQSTLSSIVEFLKNGAGSFLTSTLHTAQSIFSMITNQIISFIFAIYILLQKEKLSLQFKKVFYALLPQKAADYILKAFTLSNKIFSSFITGQCTEAIILGFMFFATLTILKIPYALLIGCLIAVTALIPIVGAFIGCFIGAFLILMVSPVQALIFIVVFLVLQQIEGNLIYPHVVGSSVGLPSIWVLAAVTIGGSLMGIVGMLIFIPLVSVCYSLFRECVNNKLKEKNIVIE